MATIILRRFSLSRDFRDVAWGTTLFYNHLRAFCAGCVAMLILTYFPMEPASPISPIWCPVIFPISYLPLMVPIALMIRAIAHFVPLVHFASWVFGFWAVGMGDPLVLLINRLMPGLLKVVDLPFFSPALIHFVVKGLDLSIARD